MINHPTLAAARLHQAPFRWGEVGPLFAPADAVALAQAFPRDHYKTVAGYGGEKDYEYEARALLPMGASVIAHPAALAEPWLALARDLCSPDYRTALATLCGIDLSSAPLEVNAFHYGPGASLGPHADLPDKVVTHVMYFNTTWNTDDGGCLHILRSRDGADIAARVAPVVGNSAVLVRADNSWHAVGRVVDGCRTSRRSVIATFYRPGAASSLWPAGDTASLHDYVQ